MVAIMTAIFQSNRVKTNIEITSNSKADYLGADPNTSQLSQIICITLNMNNISNEPFHLVKKEIKKHYHWIQDYPGKSNH